MSSKQNKTKINKEWKSERVKVAIKTYNRWTKCIYFDSDTGGSSKSFSLQYVIPFYFRFLGYETVITLMDTAKE